MDDMSVIKEAIIRIEDRQHRMEDRQMEQIKLQAEHNVLLKQHEARSLALQNKQDLLESRIKPIERHVDLLNSTGKVFMTIGIGCVVGFIVQALVRHLL